MRAPQFDEFGRRRRVVEAPDRERDREVVDHGRPGEDRRPARAPPRGSPRIASSAFSSCCTCSFGRSWPAIFSAKPWSGPCVPSCGPSGWNPSISPGRPGIHASGHVVGRRVVRGGSVGADRAELRGCHRCLSSCSGRRCSRCASDCAASPKTRLSSSARHDASMMFGLTPIVVQSRSPSVADSSTRVVAPGRGAAVEDADLVVGQVDAVERRQHRSDRLAQRRVDGVDRAVALGDPHAALGIVALADPHLDGGLGRELAAAAARR